MAALFSTSCDQDESSVAWWQGEQERTELSQEITLKQIRLDNATARSGTKELKHLTASNEQTGAKLKVLREQGASLREEVAAMENALPEMKAAHVRELRQNVIGRKFDVFNTPTGKSYKDASVVSITDGGVAIRHTEGSARLSFDDLDASQRMMFGLDADSALAAREDEDRQAVEYDRWLTARMTTIREEERKDAVIARIEASQARSERTLAAAQALVASNNRPLAQPARPVGGYYSSYYRYPRYRYYNPSRYYHTYYYVSPVYHQPYSRAQSLVTAARIRHNNYYNYTAPAKVSSSRANSLTTP